MTAVRALLLVSLPALLAAQESADNVFTWSGRVASGQTLTIRHFNGPIDVRQATGDRVEFRAERRSRRGSEVSFEVLNQGDGVSICAVFRDRSACESSRARGWGDWDNGPASVRLTVMLPQGVRLAANTGNGEVTVDRAGNDVEIRTGNGDVRISMTAGRVDVTTGNGELDIEGATGPVTANTGNGRVNVNTTTGPVNVRTGNGEIDVRMRTLSEAADMTFRTGNGAITVALPANYAGDLDASTGHGEFRSDFEIRVQGRLNPRNVRGTIGDGTSRHRLRLSSGNGRIEVRKL